MPYWHLKVGMKIWDFWVCDWFVTDRGYVGISMSLRAEWKFQLKLGPRGPLPHSISQEP